MTPPQAALPILPACPVFGRGDRFVGDQVVHIILFTQRAPARTILTLHTKEIAHILNAANHGVSKRRTEPGRDIHKPEIHANEIGGKPDDNQRLPADQFPRRSRSFSPRASPVLLSFSVIFAHHPFPSALQNEVYNKTARGPARRRSPKCASIFASGRRSRRK